MAEMPGIARPERQALPQLRDRMTFLYLFSPAHAGVIPPGQPVFVGVALFPAHAGVILWATIQRRSYIPFPRPRGGDPQTTRGLDNTHSFSPPTRG